MISIYRKRAKRYDWTPLLLYLIGFRHWTYRKRVVEALGLKKGDTVYVSEVERILGGNAGTR